MQEEAPKKAYKENLKAYILIQIMTIIRIPLAIALLLSCLTARIPTC